MATINFKIRQGKNKTCSIYLIFSYGRKKELRYSLGIKVQSKENWNRDKQRVKNVVAEPYASNMNKKIVQTQLFFEDKFQELANSGVNINNKILRNELDMYLGKKTGTATPTSFKTLLECYQWYYEYYSKHSLPTTKRQLAKGTIKSYKTAYKVIKEFNDDVYALTYSRINLDFYSHFIEFMNKKGYSKNYVSNNIKMLKTIMNFAWENKFHNNTSFKSRAFSKINEDVQSIYLNENELGRLAALKLKGRMDNVRDLFLIGANTGLRVSDFNRLVANNIKNVHGFRYIEIKSKKTGNLVAVPLKSEVLNILNKRKGSPPYKMPAQNINNLLKELGKMAGLDEPVQISKTIGGELRTEVRPKYELISTHCARRSFCTNAYLAGMSTFDIMVISGHKTEKSFYKYIKVSNLERLKKIAKHPFFN